MVGYPISKELPVAACNQDEQPQLARQLYVSRTLPVEYQRWGEASDDALIDQSARAVRDIVRSGRSRILAFTSSRERVWEVGGLIDALYESLVGCDVSHTLLIARLFGPSKMTYANFSTRGLCLRLPKMMLELVLIGGKMMAPIYH